MIALVFAVVATAGPENLVQDPGFAQALAHWTAHPAQYIEHAAVSEDGVLRVAVDESVPTQWRSLVQRREASPGERYALTAQVRTEGIRDGGRFTIALHFFDADNNRVGHADAFAFDGLEDWTAAVCRGEAPPGTVAMTLGVHNTGIGAIEVRGLHLERLPDAAEAPGPGGVVTLRVTQTVTVDSLIGFGAEDDGWFFNALNAQRGATQADYTLREARIEWMRPGWIRSFFWIRDWNPSMDLASFDWDTDNMRSQYRTLDLYERLGTRVTVCHTEWGWHKAWTDPVAYAGAVGELMEHLIVTRGYSCIRDWTLTNEPNLFFIHQGGDWAAFVHLHELVAAEFERRGLELNIVGSDDGENLLWFDKSVGDEALAGLSELYASHAYFDAVSIPFMADFYRERVTRLRARETAKPFVMAEYGFFDHRSAPPDQNPFMEEYGYALLNHRAIIEGLNEGVAGFNIWCMSEVYYPGGQRPMNFGLWHFVDRDSAVRPVYHSLAAFTRHARPGMQALRCESTHPEWVNAARVGETLFWFNACGHPVAIRVEGMELSSVRAYTEDSLDGDRECGKAVAVGDDGVFEAPARSFGHSGG